MPRAKYCSGNGDMSPDTALVLFSGGQDSTVCLAWALERFSRVETIGFDYGQRHAIELTVRARLRGAHGGAAGRLEGRPRRRPPRQARCARPPFPTPRSRATRRSRWRDSGLPTTFVPGRNLIFFCFAGALAYRRGARHLVAGMCETDYSGYPDCRDDTVKAMQVALTLGSTSASPSYAADVDRQGRDLCHGRRDRRQSHCLISLSRTAIAVIWATAAIATTWGFRLWRMPGLPVAGARLCQIQGSKEVMIDNERRRRIEGVIFLVLFCLTIPAANWMIGHVGTVCVPNGRA